MKQFWDCSETISGMNKCVDDVGRHLTVGRERMCKCGWRKERKETVEWTQVEKTGVHA